MDILTIDPEKQVAFSEAELNSFDDFLATEIGEVISSEPSRCTRRISVGDQRYYLKQIRAEKLKSAVEIYLTLHRPHGDAYREMLNIRQLQRAGIEVMDVVAAGERRRLGFPQASFIVVSAVDGDELQELYPTLNARERQQFSEALGRLCGRMHANGFFTRLRMKDILCRWNPNDTVPSFVLIDREVRNPYPHRFSRRRAVLSMAKTERYLRKTGYQASAQEIKAFVKGYNTQIQARWPVTNQALLKLLRKNRIA